MRLKLKDKLNDKFATVRKSACTKASCLRILDHYRPDGAGPPLYPVGPGGLRPSRSKKHGGANGGVPLASSYAKTVEKIIASLDAEDYAGKKQAAAVVACDVIVVVIVKQFYAAEPAGRLVSRRLRHDSRRHIWKIRFA